MQKLRKRERTYKSRSFSATDVAAEMNAIQREKLRDKTWRTNGSTRAEEMKPGT